MAIPEQERDRFCRVLHEQRTSLYRLALSITRDPPTPRRRWRRRSVGPASGSISCGSGDKLPQWLLRITLR